VVAWRCASPACLKAIDETKEIATSRLSGPCRGIVS
jgi:hypothetical protein